MYQSAVTKTTSKSNKFYVNHDTPKQKKSKPSTEKKEPEQTEYVVMGIEDSISEQAQQDQEIWRQAMIFSEIMGPPVSRRRKRQGRIGRI